MLTESQTSDGRTLTVRLAPRTRWILTGCAVASAGLFIAAIVWQLTWIAESWHLPWLPTLAASLGLVVFCVIMIYFDARRNFTVFETTPSSLTIHRPNGMSKMYVWSDLVCVKGFGYFLLLVFQNQKPVQLTYSAGFRPSTEELNEMFGLAGVPVRTKTFGRFLLLIRYKKTDKTISTDQPL